MLSYLDGTMPFVYKFISYLEDIFAEVCKWIGSFSVYKYLCLFLEKHSCSEIEKMIYTPIGNMLGFLLVELMTDDFWYESWGQERFRCMHLYPVTFFAANLRNLFPGRENHTEGNVIAFFLCSKKQREGWHDNEK